MPTVAEKSVFSSSKQSRVIHKTQVLITTKEMSTSKHINIKVARQRTTSYRYAFEGTYLMISYSIGTSSKLMLWISSYAIDSVVSPLETAIEGSKRENETTYNVTQAKLAFTISPFLKTIEGYHEHFRPITTLVSDGTTWADHAFIGPIRHRVETGGVPNRLGRMPVKIAARQ